MEEFLDTSWCLKMMKLPVARKNEYGFPASFSGNTKSSDVYPPLSGTPGFFLDTLWYQLCAALGEDFFRCATSIGYFCSANGAN